MALQGSHQHILLFCEDQRCAESVAGELACAAGRRVDPVTGSDVLLARARDPETRAVVFLLRDDTAPTLDAVRACASLDPRPALYALGPAEDVRGVVLAIQSGIDAYFTTGELASLADELRSLRWAAQTVQPVRTVSAPELFPQLITRDERMRALFRTAAVIAGSSVPVLITGETGVGKELLARGVHDASGRTGEFVAENVAGLDDTLFSDALFGHVRGAYTGAHGDRAGLIERAADGSLFLDEIGDITAASQVKLLRVLENGTYYPLGSDDTNRSAARIVMATNSDLLARVKEGSFRIDLFFRLAAFHLQIPPLRRRRHEVPLLVRHFAEQTAVELGIHPPEFSPSLLGLLEQYDYPGNVRELQSIVVTLVSHGRDGRLDERSLELLARSILRRNSLDTLSLAPQVSFPDSLPTIEELTDQLIDEALRRTEGNQSAAARMLGVTPSAVSKRLHRRDDEG